MTFTGSGELENGSTVTLNVVHTNTANYSSSNLTWDIPGIGKLGVNQLYNGIDRIDDKMPTAWEETWGTAVGTGIQTVSGVGGGMNVNWTSTADMGGLSIHAAFAPKAKEGGGTNDKATSGVGGSNMGSGYDIVLEHSGLMDGLNIFAGYSSIDQLATGHTEGDRTATAAGLTYAIGGATVGYQYSKDSLNVLSGVNHYENNAYGVSFAVNDDLTLSYGVHKSKQNHTNTGKNAELEASSFQVSYSMGGATLKLAQTDVDSGAYDSSTATDRSGTTLVLSLAF
jgi:outer membrane protein OmpU